jgi:hypothetical protein
LAGILWRFLLSVTTGQINGILSIFSFLFRQRPRGGEFNKAFRAVYFMLYTCRYMYFRGTRAVPELLSHLANS